MQPSIEQPTLTVFVKPYFFIANRNDAEIVSASPSISDVLGYGVQQVIGIPYARLFSPACPVNQDARSRDFAPPVTGQSYHLLRTMIDQTGEKRFLSMRTITLSSNENRGQAYQQSIAEDVTESFHHHARLLRRHREFSAAEERMSEQENAIAEKVLQGKMNREIADELALSERTIDRRRARIMRLFGVETGFALVSKLVQGTELNASLQMEQTADWRRAENCDKALRLFA